jgi:hypothetical protein
MHVDLDGRALFFLHESNAIESIRNIDYRRPENARAGAGQVSAFLDSQERAFVDGNGRTGRLLANHLITMMNQPLIVFRADERPAFYAAHSSKKAMRLFLFEKTREAMYWPDGKVWVRKERYDFADRYVDPDSGREMVMECHDLVAAAEAWRSS